MGLIIKNKIAQLKKGYPTVSDKYNVQGGIYEGDSKGTALHFGDLLAYGSATGHYVKLTTEATVDKLAGICLATNVKLANRYPGDSNASVETVKGEAFNLLVRGFIAVAIKDAAYVTALKDYKDALADYEKDPTNTTKKTTLETAKATLETAKKTAIASIKEGQSVNLETTDATLVVTGGTAIPGVYFTGVAEFVGEELLAEINYKM